MKRQETLEKIRQYKAEEEAKRQVCEGPPNTTMVFLNVIAYFCLLMLLMLLMLSMLL